MKVAHVIGSLGPGGAEKLVVDLLPILRQTGTEVELWVLTQAEQLPDAQVEHIKYETSAIEALANAGVPVRLLGKRPQRDRIRILFKLNECINIARPDIVHAHLEDVAFHTTLALFWRRVQLVQTVHNTHIDRPALLQSLHSLAGSHLICISQSSVNAVHALRYPKTKITKIVNATAAPVRKRDRLQLHRPVMTIITVGRLTEQKNHKLLIAAFAKLVVEIRRAGGVVPCLKIVGEGPLRRELVDLVTRLNLDNLVQFLGIRQDVHDLLDASDAFVLPSSWEGMSIALLEAIAAGLPIIATDVGGNRESLENGRAGILVPPDDVEALVSAMRAVAENTPLRMRLGEEALRVAQKNSMERCAAEHVALYSELIQARC